MKLKTVVLVYVAVIVWVVAFGATLAQGATAPCVGGDAQCAAQYAANAHCYEDNACWNWAKMGNHMRGVTLLDGSPRVVGVCGFNRLWSAGAIRYRSGLIHMKGDRFARTLTDCPWRLREKRPYPQHAEGIY